MQVYFDNAASTKILEIFKEDIIKSYSFYANPSSIHREGKKTRYELEKSREEIAKRLKIDSKELIFTSGATESNNILIKGLALKNPDGHIITSSIEHPSVLNVCKYLEGIGYSVTYLKPNKDGIISLDELKNSVKENTFLVSIMGVNNETGVKQPIKEIGEFLENTNIFFHSDITQLLLKDNLNFSEIKLDSFSASFHKIHGPKGLGLCYLSSKLKLDKIFHGGEQEKNRRSGTENVNSIILASKVFSYMFDNLENNIEYISNLENRLLKGLEKLKDKVVINGKNNRIHNIINLQIKGYEIDLLLPILDMRGIYVSGGSACQSGSLKVSNTLIEQGLSVEEAKSSIRVSLSIENTEEEIDYFLEVLEDITK